MTRTSIIATWPHAEAITRYGKPEIFNTDQGSQFTCSEFTGLLHGHGIRISMPSRAALTVS